MSRPNTSIVFEQIAQVRARIRQQFQALSPQQQAAEAASHAAAKRAGHEAFHPFHIVFA